MKRKYGLRVLAGVLVLAVLLVVACAKATPTATPKPTATPTPTAMATVVPTATPTSKPAEGPKGTVNVAHGNVGPSNWELYMMKWPFNDRPQFFGINETLLIDEITDKGREMFPCVAKDWELDENGVTLTLNTPDIIPWHDSKYGYVTIDDILFSFDRATAEGTRWTRAEVFRTNYKYKEIQVIDDHTILLPWNTMNLQWYQLLSSTGVTIQSKKMADDKGLDYMNLNAMGTGPMEVVDELADDHIYLEAVAPHWRETSTVARIEVIQVPEEASRFAMLETGEADIIQMGLHNMQAIDNIPGARVVTEPSLGRNGAQISLAGQYYMTEDHEGNPTDRTPLTDLPWVGDPSDPEDMANALKVRRAMAMSIDRDGLVEGVLGGNGDKHYWWNMGPGHPRWTAEMEEKYAIPYDPDEAKKLLAEAGYPSGFDFEYWIPSGLNPLLIVLGEAMIPMFQEIGLNPKVDNSAYSSIRPTMLARTIDSAWIWQEAAWNMDINSLYRFHTKPVWNAGQEYAEALDFEERILGASSVEEAWDVVSDEWIPWLYETVPMFQTVSYANPWGVGPRIKEWKLRVNTDTYPRCLWRVTLAD